MNTPNEPDITEIWKFPSGGYYRVRIRGERLPEDDILRPYVLSLDDLTEDEAKCECLLSGIGFETGGRRTETAYEKTLDEYRDVLNIVKYWRT